MEEELGYVFCWEQACVLKTWAGACLYMPVVQVLRGNTWGENQKVFCIHSFPRKQPSSLGKQADLGGRLTRFKH